MNTITVTISILVLLAIWLWFRSYSKLLYEKGRFDERLWQKENNYEAQHLMGAAVNRGYAEWKVIDVQTGKAEFKWKERLDVSRCI